MGLLLSAESGDKRNSTLGSSSLNNDTLVKNSDTGTTITNLDPGQKIPQAGIGYSYDTNDSMASSPGLGLNVDATKQLDNQNSTTSVIENSSSINMINGTKTIATTNEDEFKMNLFGTSVYPFKWLTLPTLYSWLKPLSSLAMIIGCVMPYVPQYLTIQRNRNSSGFSTFVCLTLLIANILRIAFWFGHPFELPLLIQSVIMVCAQILLLELCVRVKRQSSSSHLRRRFLMSNPRFFWRWTDLLSYLEFLCLFTALLVIAMYFFIDCEIFVETVGYCALVIESMLGLPQVLKNYKKKSVLGMSLSMVAMWLAGDTFKTGYFIANDVPFQFWLCGLLQITIDLLILFQVCLFRQNSKW